MKIWAIALTMSTALILAIFWLVPKLTLATRSNVVNELSAKAISEETDREHEAVSRANESDPRGSDAAEAEPSHVNPESAVETEDESALQQDEVVSEDRDLVAKAPDSLACDAGLSQSPINLEAPLKTRELRPLVLTYGAPQSLRLIGRGRQRKIELDEGKAPRMRYLGKDFALESVSLRLPAEHLIEGESFGAELQFLHRDSSRNRVLVMAIMVRGGSSSEWPQSLIHSLESGAEFNFSSLLPSERTYFQYTGSLTESPCNEGVTWVVLKKPLFASEEDLAALGQMIGTKPRPLQAINGRSLRMSHQ